jgi:hypothetical protein
MSQYIFYLLKERDVIFRINQKYIEIYITVMRFVGSTSKSFFKRSFADRDNESGIFLNLPDFIFFSTLHWLTS